MKRIAIYKRLFIKFNRITFPSETASFYKIDIPFYTSKFNGRFFGGNVIVRQIY